MYEIAINTLAEVMKMAIPIAVVYELGNLIVGTFMRAAFGGKLWFGK